MIVIICWYLCLIFCTAWKLEIWGKSESEETCHWLVIFRFLPVKPSSAIHHFICGWSTWEPSWAQESLLGSDKSNAEIQTKLKEANNNHNKGLAYTAANRITNHHSSGSETFRMGWQRWKLQSSTSFYWVNIPPFHIHKLASSYVLLLAL